MSFKEIIIVDELRAMTKKGQNEEALKRSKKQAAEDLIDIKEEKHLRYMVEWRRKRYVKQFWNKLSKPSFIESIVKRIKNAAKNGKNHVEIPVIWIFYNRFFCVGHFSCTMCSEYVCEKVFSTYFPKETLTPQTNTIFYENGTSSIELTGMYLYNKSLICSASILSQDEELLKNVKTHLAINGIPLNVELYDCDDTIGLKLRW